jgi:hypothetical protein
MGYERNDRRFSRDQGYGYRGPTRDQYGSARDRYEGSGYGRRPEGYDYQDRGFIDRAGDEVRSWFGDEEAERRRRWDEREREREYERSGYGREARSGWGDRESFGSARGREYSDRQEGYGRGYDDRVERYGYGSASSGGAAYGGYDLSAPTNYAPYSGGTYRENGPSSERHDPGYRSWRDRQMDEFDRDYDEYRREHQQKFEHEFGTWRNTRQTQRQSLSRVQEHQDVVGSDGQHLGTVDKVRGDRIILTKNDQEAGGHHHSIPCSWVSRVEERVELNKTADQARAAWKDEENRSRGGLFGDNDRDRDNGSDGHVLNRSFSGTY